MLGHSLFEKIKTSQKATRLVIAILILVGLLIFLNSWADQAFNTSTSTPTEVRILNGTQTVIQNSTFVVENYYPLRDYVMRPVIIVEFDNESNFQISNTEEDLARGNIKIDSFQITDTYGDKELSPPYKVVNPKTFYYIHTPGMAKTTLLVNWSYNMTSIEHRDDYDIYLRMSDDPNYVSNWGNTPLYLLRSTWFLFLNFSSYFFFVLLGGLLSWYVFGKGRTMKDYGILTRFTPSVYQKAVNSKKKEIDNSLSNLANFPKNEQSWKRLLFGVSMLILKTLTNNKCKQHYEICSSYNIAPYRLDSLKKTFAKQEKQTFDKIQDMLPELKTVLIITGFLATVGISFSFNLGAVGPFLYSVILFYVFFNLGSAIQFVWESKTDRNWISVIFVIAIVALVLPNLVDGYRYLIGLF